MLAHDKGTGTVRIGPPLINPAGNINSMNRELDLLKILYRRTFDENAEGVTVLRGGGSDRRLYRLSGPGHRAVGVCGDHAGENRAYIGFSLHFRGHGCPVPEIYSYDIERDIYLEQDLGDETLMQWLKTRCTAGLLPEKARSMYSRVLEWLPVFQVRAGRSIDYSLCYQHERFGRESMRWDSEYFFDRFLRPVCGEHRNLESLHNDINVLIEHLLEVPQDFFLYRDFQSQNIMISGTHPFFIDYQSGRRGALQYDVASLLFDPYTGLCEPDRRILVEHYLQALEREVDEIPAGPVKEKGRRAVEDFARYFEGFAVMRLLQALGAYGFLSRVKGKRWFLKYIPTALAHLHALVRDSDLGARLPALRDMAAERVEDSVLSSKLEPDNGGR